MVLDKNLSKSWIENQRASSTMELSQTYYSSSSCSSFSSLDGNRSTQQDLSSTDRMLFPEKPFKCSRKLKSSPDSNNGPDYYPDDNLTRPPNMPSAQSSYPTLGIRNLVKDSIYRDTRDLSARTFSSETVECHTFDRREPRCLDEPPNSGTQGKSKGTMDTSESLRVLAKLRESSWNPSESGQQPGLAYDAPRFSYDRRESGSKLKEMPRLSLDIKEGPLRAYEMDLRSKRMNAAERSRSTAKNFSAALEVQQEQPVACKRLPSVVAKLMGLEVLPEPNDNTVTSSQASKSVQERKQQPMLSPVSLSHNEPTPRQQRNLDAAIRNVPNSKFPVETAPWKQQQRIVLPRKLPKGWKRAHGKEQPAASVYSEIETRLKDLDFQQSNKDLRALKQILDSMQAKGLLQNKKREEASMKFYDDNESKEVTDANLRLDGSTRPTQMLEGASSLSLEQEIDAERFFKSPIVIMKPAKSAGLLGDANSSIIPLGAVSDIPQPRACNNTDRRKNSQINRATIEQQPKPSRRVPASQPLSSSDGRENGKNEVIRRKQKSSSQLMTESSSRRQQLPRDSNGSLVKHKKSTSPRLPRNKHDEEQRARPPISSVESNRNQRESSDRSHLDTVSPRRKVGRKPAHGEGGHQNGASSRTRSVNQQGNDLSTRSDRSTSVASELDIEVSSADRSKGVDTSGFQQGNQTPPGRNPQKVKTYYDANKDLSSMDPAATIPERPSPVSVLDSSFDQENIFSTSKASNSPNVDDKPHPSDESCKPSGTKPTKLTTQSKNSKLANVASLLEKLQQLSINKDDDEVAPVDHMAFLCETKSPDHRYVSEILLASGLLMKDLGSGLLQIQLHTSGYHINPDLFHVLEQRRSGWISKPEGFHRSRSTTNSDDPQRTHRKLLFDAVNELLFRKFEKPNLVHSVSSFAGAGDPSSGQQLVKSICSELEELKRERSRMCQQDNSSVIPDAEILHRLEGWTSFRRDLLPGMVLEIERYIFKELVDEVVRGESADGPKAKAGSGRRGRRRLFA